MKERIVSTIIIIMLLVGFIVVVEQRNKYKDILDSINDQPYYTDEIELSADTYYKIYFEYDRKYGEWWELYIGE